MKPSTRTPTTKQGRVLFVLDHLDGVQPDSWHDTRRVHAELDRMQQRLRSLSPVSTQRETFDQLNAVARHDWVLREVSPAIERDNMGSHLRWFITDAGREALGRAMEAAQAQPKEDPVEGTTTQDPPATSAPYDDDPVEETVDGDEASLSELDDDPVLEGELEEDDNPPVNEGSNQLTLAIGGPPPTVSKLKVRGATIDYGSTRQFKQMERIPIKGYIELRKVGTEVKNNGKVERQHEAVLVIEAVGDQPV